MGPGCSGGTLQRMNTPALSICIPCHMEGLPYLMRSLRTLAVQTCEDFEVRVGLDVEEFVLPAVTEGLRACGLPDRLVVRQRMDSPRYVARRNMARNLAAAGAKAEYLWFVDCDFLWDERTVEHLLTGMVHGRALSPVLVSIDEEVTCRL